MYNTKKIRRGFNAATSIVVQLNKSLRPFGDIVSQIGHSPIFQSSNFSELFCIVIKFNFLT